jgi:hypothetical protein
LISGVLAVETNKTLQIWKQQKELYQTSHGMIMIVQDAYFLAHLKSMICIIVIKAEYLPLLQDLAVMGLTI